MCERPREAAKDDTMAKEQCIMHRSLSVSSEDTKCTNADDKQNCVKDFASAEAVEKLTRNPQKKATLVSKLLFRYSIPRCLVLFICGYALVNFMPQPHSGRSYTGPKCCFLPPPLGQ